MSEVGLTYNEEFKVLICRKCEYAISPKNIYCHVKGCQPEVSNNNLQAYLSMERTLAKLEDVIPKEAIKTGAAVPAIQGLKVTKGFKCESCHKCFGVVRSFINHASSEHVNEEVKYIICDIQRLQNFPGSPYFPVKIQQNSRQNSSSLKSSFDECRNLIVESSKHSLLVDERHKARAVSLQANELFLSRFMQKFSEQKIEKVLKSMNSTVDDLKTACETYLDHINDLISNQNLYLRRCIQKFSGSSKMAFGHLQEKETVKAYSRILYRSIICLSELDVPEARKTVMEKENILNRIYGLMYVLLTQKGSNHEGQEELMFHDVFNFLCMKNQRLMRNAADITKDMSAWKFILKGTALIYLGTADSDPKGFCAEYLSQDEPTNFDLICHKKAVLSNLARQTPFVPRIQYNLSDPTVLTIDGHTDITLLHVKKGVQQLKKVISNKLKSICPHLEDLPGIDTCTRDLTGIHEDGYSFLSDEINNLIDDSTHGFINVMDKLGVTNPNEIDEGVARLFLNNCATLNADILAAVHITCGYPFRGPEYESMLIQDSYIGHRSLLVLPKEKQLVIVGRYSKTRNLGAPEHIRPKLLPKWLSDLLFKYHLYIRPAESIIARSLYGPNASVIYSNYVFVANNGVIDNPTSVLKYRLSRYLGVQINVSMWRHIVEAWLQPSPHLMNDLELDEIDSDVDKMAGHSHETSMRYGYSEEDVIGISSKRYLSMLRLSRKWHDLIDNAKEQIAVTNRAPKRMASDYGSDLEKKLVRLNTTYEEPVALLKAVKGDNWDFKSYEQKLAVQHAMQCKDNVLAVLPTGGGKSLVYELALINHAIKMKNHVYGILCYPINAIKRQIEEKLNSTFINVKDFNNDIVEYITNHQSKGELCTLILVHPNSLRNPNFWNMIKRKKPSFVCVDEAHLATQWSDFVDGFKYFTNFTLHNCPIVLLSATAPPHEVPSIMKQLAIPDMHIVRAETNRRNLQMNILEYNDVETIPQEIVSNIEEFVLNRNIDERAIVNVQTIGDMSLLYHHLQMSGISVLKYHGRMTEDQQRSAQTSWIQEGPIIICTQGFGLGVDYPAVTRVIHYKSPRDIKQYDQDIGRGGRDGRLCHCYLYHFDEKLTFEKPCENAMMDLLQTKNCRRKALKGYVDGVNINCEIEIDEPCDNCRDKTLSMTSNIRARILEAMKDLNDFIDFNLGNGCVLGYLNGESCNHERGNLRECKHLKNGECFYCMNQGHKAKECPYKAVRRGYCFKCFLPLHVLGGFIRFHDHNYGGNCTTRFADLIMPYCAYIFKNEKDYLERKSVPTTTFKDYHEHLMGIEFGLPNAFWLMIEHWKGI